MKGHIGEDVHIYIYIYSHRESSQSQNQNPPNRNRRNWKWSFRAKRGWTRKWKRGPGRCPWRTTLISFSLTSKSISPSTKSSLISPSLLLQFSLSFFSFFVYHWKLRNSSLMFCVKFCRSSACMGSRKSTRFKRWQWNRTL